MRDHGIYWDDYHEEIGIETDMFEIESNYNLQFNTEDCSLTKGSINLEDKVNRLHPQLGCTYCPPNKGENEKRGSRKRRAIKPKQRAQAKELR